jgi:hypothetical protein
MPKNYEKAERAIKRILWVLGTGETMPGKTLYYKTALSIDWYTYALNDLLSDGRVVACSGGRYRANQ